MATRFGCAMCASSAADAGWFQRIAIETNLAQTGFAMISPVEDDAYQDALARNSADVAVAE